MRGLLLALLALALPAFAADPAPRIEAKSADLLAVGVLHEDNLTLHVSRLEDNAPLKDAEVAVTLRGTRHPAVAATDGGYTVTSPDLKVPGAAALEIEITAGTLHEVLKGTLEVTGNASKPEDNGGVRQYGWWVLNFAVCIAFLWLFSRRKKSPDATSAD